MNTRFITVPLCLVLATATVAPAQTPQQDEEPEYETLVFLAPRGPLFLGVRLEVDDQEFRDWLSGFLFKQLDSKRTGSLEAARGSHHVGMDGVDLVGEQDIHGVTWSGTSWSTASANGTSWSGTNWNGTSWSGTSWSGTSWSGTSWSGTSWSNQYWTGTSWSGTSWSGTSWSGTSWSGTSWTSYQPPVVQGASWR